MRLRHSFKLILTYTDRQKKINLELKRRRKKKKRRRRTTTKNKAMSSQLNKRVTLKRLRSYVPPSRAKPVFFAYFPVILGSCLPSRGAQRQKSPFWGQKFFVLPSSSRAGYGLALEKRKKHRCHLTRGIVTSL